MFPVLFICESSTCLRVGISGPPAVRTARLQQQLQSYIFYHDLNYNLNCNKTTWGWGWAEQQAAAHTEKQSDHSETSLQETADHRLHSAPRAGWRPSWELKYGLKNLTRHGDPLEVDWVVHVGSFPVKIDIQYFQTFFLDSVIKPDSWISSLPRI